MADSRIEAYAKLLVERSLDVQPGWQVLIRTTPLARPLLDEVVRLIGRRGAYAIVRMSFSLWPVDPLWAAEAPEELVGRLAPLDLAVVEQMDARITIDAPENIRDGSALSPARSQLASKARRPFFQRSSMAGFPWVGCQFPTPALAQEAGMSNEAFADFFYGAVLRDWDAEGERMARFAKRFDAADTVRIVGAGTDLKLGIAGREGMIDKGYRNLPGGEFFFSPVESETVGEIAFLEFGTEFSGTKISGIRLRFEGGRVVDASAETGEEALLSALDTDEGARVVGELGIGCNEGITRYMGNTLFDEKIAGTIHLALGASYAFAGGLNESAIHWDIVKDLRVDGRIECDGEVVQEHGRWLV